MSDLKLDDEKKEEPVLVEKIKKKVKKDPIPALSTPALPVVHKKQRLPVRLCPPVSKYNPMKTYSYVNLQEDPNAMVTVWKRYARK